MLALASVTRDVFDNRFLLHPREPHAVLDVEFHVRCHGEPMQVMSLPFGQSRSLDLFGAGGDFGDALNPNVPLLILILVGLSSLFSCQSNLLSELDWKPVVIDILSVAPVQGLPYCTAFTRYGFDVDCAG
jgi:hypothetical protein